MRDDIDMADVYLLAAPWTVGLVLAAVALLLFPLKQTPGWRQVTPGVSYWAAMIFALALAGLIGWVWMFVGSSRPDGATQMRIAWWLAFLFGCGAAVMGWLILSLHRLKIAWRGETLRWSGQAAVPMRDLESLSTKMFGGTRLRFHNGAHLTVDGGAYGASALIEKIEDVNGLAPSDRPPEH
ncbi:hypothetical protein [Aestuariivirga sp.]|uniref:hypothetical protein n=1 Tax=Aestuariivirga sp. TaxID=2650926 RepID=UPI0039E4C26E